MSRIFLYAHGGSGNHGCEAIVRSTIKILNESNITLISANPDEDIKYGLGDLCEIIKDTSDKISKLDLDFWKAYFVLKVKKDYIPMDKLRYKKSFSNIKKGDIALSIGGDNYCYKDVNKYVMLHDMLKERGAKTVLWGCSVEPEVACRPEIMKDLARYDLITARENITYEVLKKINPNTILVSDPAFQLDVEEIELPENFLVGNTVGINLSPMVIENEKIPGMTWSNYIELINYILNETDMNIALIPHVVWEKGDDRIPLKKLYEKFKNCNRICLVEDASCTKLKYIISKCRFFVGARTHSTIAAYSMEIPTLVLGYSVKARGIAKDLFGNTNNHVLSVQELEKKDILCNKFKILIEKENKIKHCFHEKMEEYCLRNIKIKI